MEAITGTDRNDSLVGASGGEGILGFSGRDSLYGVGDSDGLFGASDNTVARFAGPQIQADQDGGVASPLAMRAPSR